MAEPSHLPNTASPNTASPNTASPITAPPITAGQWNRTLLHRQHLLTRANEDAIDVIDRLVGMQSQDPRAAFYGLASRIEGFATAELDGLLVGREVVRMALLRGTVLLFDSEDARWVRPLAQRALAVEANIHRKRLAAADPEAVVADAADLLAQAPRDGGISGAELGTLLARRHRGENPATLTALARCGLPLVQIPPRGLWNAPIVGDRDGTRHHGVSRVGVATRGTTPTYRLLDDWIGPGEPAVDGAEAVRELIRLYLRGFGPSSAKAVTRWSGITGIGPVLTAMEKEWELVEYRGPHGERLYDLDGLDLVDGDRPAPVRLIAPFDHLLVAQADRGRIADDEFFARTVTPNGRSPGFVLCDGRLAGIWHPRSPGQTPDVELFVNPTTPQRAELDDEIERVRGLR